MNKGVVMKVLAFGFSLFLTATAWHQAHAEPTQAETCGLMEDLSLAIIRAKQAGVPEISLRSEFRPDAGDFIDSTLVTAYSHDNMTEEYMLAMARLKCTMMFMLEEDDGSRKEPEADLDPTLPALVWLEECSRLRWFDFHEKLLGKGTMISAWEARKIDAKYMAAKLWPKRDDINHATYTATTMREERDAGRISEGQYDLGGDVMNCVVSRLTLNVD